MPNLAPKKLISRLRTYNDALITAWKIKPSFVLINLVFPFRQIPSRLLTVWIMEYAINSALAHVSFIYILAALSLYLIWFALTNSLKGLIDEKFNPVAEEEIRFSIQEQLHLRAADSQFSFLDNPAYFDDYSQALNRKGELVFLSIKQSSRLIESIVSSVTLALAIAYTSPVVITFVVVDILIGAKLYSLKARASAEKQRYLIPFRRRVRYINEIFYRKPNAENLRVGYVADLARKDLSEQATSIISIVKQYGTRTSALVQTRNFCDTFMFVLTLGWLAFCMIQNEIDAGAFAAMSNAALMFQSALDKVTEISPRLSETCIALEDASAFEHYPTESELTQHSEKIPEILNLLSFRNISFKYPYYNVTSNVTSRNNDTSFLTLKGINLDVKRGETIAIVGQNGAGKSTLLKLLARFYEPDTGVIQLDGIPTNKIAPSNLRKVISFVFQDSILYEFTIAENILGRRCETQSDVEIVNDALQKVGLFTTTASLPNGIHTMLGKEFDADGFHASGGQLQRLAIARAIARETPIIIMDEASSAIDPLAEQELYSMIAEFTREKICIVITHRMGLAKHAARIAVLEGGEITEFGSHEDLLLNKGTYARMWDAHG